MYNRSLLFTLLISALAISAAANPLRPDTQRARPVTTTATAAVAPVPSLPTLSDVLIIGDYRSATFNESQTLNEGDTINGYQLVEIHPQYVLLERRGNITAVELPVVGSLQISPAIEE